MDRTEYREYIPSPALRKHVACFWSRRSQSGPRTSTHRVLPDGCIDILFVAGAEPALEVVGTMRTAVEVRLEGPGRIAAVRFRPGGALPLLGVPASELTGRTIALEEFWGRDAARLAERVAEAREVRAQVGTLEREIASRTRAARAVDPYVSAAVELIVSSHGRASSDAW